MQSTKINVMERLSLLVAAILGEDFTFDRHAEVLSDVIKYNNITESDIDNDLEFVKEIINANIFLS